MCLHIWTHFSWLPLLTFILSLFWMLCNIITSPVVQLTNRFAFTQNNLMPYGLLVVHKAIQQISAIQRVLATSKNCLDALSSFVPWTTTTTSVEGLIYGHFAWTDLIQKCIKSLTRVTNIHQGRQKSTIYLMSPISATQAWYHKDLRYYFKPMMWWKFFVVFSRAKLCESLQVIFLHSPGVSPTIDYSRN